MIDIFERIETFFQRLEIYTEVPRTSEMMDIVVRIMVEVLSILGIAMKEIKQGRMSKYSLIQVRSLLIEGCSERFGKRLIGRTEMEDGLKRLDKLTQEEARMATAQNLKATHAVDKGVKEVVDTVVAIDDTVARVDDRVAAVNDRVASVDNTVKGVEIELARAAHPSLVSTNLTVILAPPFHSPLDTHLFP